MDLRSDIDWDFKRNFLSEILKGFFFVANFKKLKSVDLFLEIKKLKKSQK